MSNWNVSGEKVQLKCACLVIYLMQKILYAIELLIYKWPQNWPNCKISFKIVNTLIFLKKINKAKESANAQKT